MIETFLLKLKAITPCLEHHTKPDGQRLLVSLFLQILQVATKIGIRQSLLVGDNFTSKRFRELSLVESFFNIKQDYCVQTRTLLKPMRVF